MIPETEHKQSIGGLSQQHMPCLAQRLFSLHLSLVAVYEMSDPVTHRSGCEKDRRLDHIISFMASSSKTMKTPLETKEIIHLALVGADASVTSSRVPLRHGKISV